MIKGRLQENQNKRVKNIKESIILKYLKKMDPEVLEARKKLQDKIGDARTGGKGT